MRREGAEARLIDESRLTTRRNAFGPTLMDAEAIFTAAGRLIEAADREVDIMTFAVEPDSEPYLELVRAFGRRVASRPIVAAPYRLRIYTDHISTLFSGGLARRKAQSILKPWIDLFRAHRIDPQLVQIEVYVHAHGTPVYHHGARYSVHDKMLIADGAYLHIGGANPQAKNDFRHPERDTAIVVKGEVASAALDAFDALWKHANFACTVEADGRDYRSRCTDRQSPSEVEHADAVKHPSLDEFGVPATACLPITLISKGKRGYFNVAGYSNPWAKGVLAAVSTAERSIDLTSPNFNTPPLQGALVDAMAKRDVRVRLLLPYERNEIQVNGIGGFGSNSETIRVLRACAVVARGASEAEYRRVTANFSGGWWVAENQASRFTGDGPGCDHIKFASIDEQALIVGSANLDDQSFYHSSETSILIDNPVVTRAVSRFVFEPEWARSERFTLFTRPRGEAIPTTPSGPDVAGTDARGLCAGLGYSLK